MPLQVGCVDHERVCFVALIGQFEKHPDEHTFVVPALPTAVEGLVRPVDRRRITPPQAIAIDEYYPAQNALIVNAWLSVGLWEERLQLCHLIIAQPVKIAHVTAPFLEL